jgi:dephospho-CoA kinase
MKPQTRIIAGILGSVGAGKSTVCRLFAEKGARVLDADAMAHAVLAEPEVREEIRAAFGRGVLFEDGSVDRKALADLVFADPAALGKLEKLVHPKVRLRIEEEVRRFRAREERGFELLVLDVPLLATSPLKEHCDELVFVEATPERRRERVRERGWTPEELERRERAQPSAAEKRRLATHIVENDGSIESTRHQVHRLYEHFHCRMMLNPAATIQKA